MLENLPRHCKRLLILTYLLNLYNPCLLAGHDHVANPGHCCALCRIKQDIAPVFRTRPLPLYMYSLLLYKPPFSWPLCYVVSEHDGIVAFSGGGFSHHPNTLTQFGNWTQGNLQTYGCELCSLVHIVNSVIFCGANVVGS